MSSEESKFPEAWLCPITHEVMRDPVLAPDGYTYERSAVTAWLERHRTSPITRQPMASGSLTPNRALRDTIEAHLAAQTREPRAASTDARSKRAPASAAASSAGGGQVHISVSPHPVKGDRRLAHISVVPPASGPRLPTAFIAVLDVSGSMGLDATAGRGTDLEHMGFSRLDLVKHSVNTVIATMSDRDSLALVPFSVRAEVALDLTRMNDAGKARARAALGRMNPDGGTNLWDGVRRGLELARSSKCKGRNVVLLVLTDGEPNMNPPRGILPSLQRDLARAPRTCTIHTFGFGYDLDSELLSGMAALGDGAFAYIPDCSMVGTVFINFLSNVLAAAWPCASLELGCDGGLRDAGTQLVGLESEAATRPARTVSLGIVGWGQSRDVLLDLPAHVAGRISAAVTLAGGRAGTGAPGPKAAAIVEPGASLVPGGVTADAAKAALLEQFARMTLVAAFGQALGLARGGRVGDAMDAVKSAHKALARVAGSMPSVDAMLRDVESDKESEAQISKSFSREDWFLKWGRHHVPSLVRAHVLQQCHNFKDPGVQRYGGDAFRDIQGQAEDAFCSLPPPKPSNVPVADAYAHMPADMGAFHDYSGGCIHGDTMVRMADGSTRRVREVRAGDVVDAVEGPARVRCVVETAPADATAKFVHLGDGLRITPWHPVRTSGGKWAFPADLGEAVEQPCDAFFSFLLDAHHVMVAGDVQCICLAHGFQEDVARHDYFGTQRVVDDLKRLPGWAEGHIRVSASDLQRDPDSHLVVGMAPVAPAPAVV